MKGERPAPNAFLCGFAFVLLIGRTLVAGPLDSAGGFIRGDVEQNRSIGLTDALLIFAHLFLQVPQVLDCEDGADVNDNGWIELTDGIHLLFFLFGGDPSIPPPLESCDVDPTPDNLGCGAYWPCPPEEWSNSLGMPFRYIPPGTFSMGSPLTERGREQDETLHEVELTCGFYIGVTEITQAQYLKVMGHNPSYFIGLKGGIYWGTDLDRPVENLTWDDAVRFCTRLTAREDSVFSEGREYRLPTEAEWEYACRAGTRTRFWFDDILDCPDDYDGNRCPPVEPYMVTNVQEGPITTVGIKEPNPWGLYDVHGLMAEWCRDWYGPYPIGRAVDPEGPRQGRERAVRSLPEYTFGLKDARSARRYHLLPRVTSSNLGFRVVLSLPDCRRYPHPP